MSKVDFVITELNVGGAEQALTHIAVGLHELGDDIRVYSFGPLPEASTGNEGRHGLVRTLRNAGIEVASGDSTGFYQTPSLYSKLRRWLARRPDALCQTFLVHANILGITAAASVARSTRSMQRPPRVAGIRVAEPRLHRIWAERYALRQADHVVCVSSAVEAFARARMHLPEERTSVIGNAVDADRFVQAKPFAWNEIGWPNDADVVLFIGRFHAQKNLGFLQSNLDAIVPPGTQRKLAVVGDGPLRPQLNQWAGQVPGDRVRILSWQPDVAPLIAACRLLVLPSHYEGMPNVILEAMACAKPVVCSLVEGSAELIGDDPNQGYPVNDAVTFTSQVNRLLSDPDFAMRIGRANQARVLRDFSVPRMVHLYRDLYTRLIEEV